MWKRKEKLGDVDVERHAGCFGLRRRSSGYVAAVLRSDVISGI
jgi:hypothetical protein